MWYNISSIILLNDSFLKTKFILYVYTHLGFGILIYYSNCIVVVKVQVSIFIIGQKSYDFSWIRTIYYIVKKYLTADWGKNFGFTNKYDLLK